MSGRPIITTVLKLLTLRQRHDSRCIENDIFITFFRAALNMIGLRLINISPFCVLDTSMCFPNPCLNDGQCSPVVNYYMCTCQHGYGGQQCDNREFSCISCRTTKRVFQKQFKTEVFILVFFISDLILFNQLYSSKKF